MNAITDITREKIFDLIMGHNVDWNGNLSEPKFLLRVFDLYNLKSSDSRYHNMYDDIVQHRINNYDWSMDWVFRDERLNLIACDDSILLKFLCEMLHPRVRLDEREVNWLVKAINELLVHDNYEIYQTGQISSHPVFGYKRINEIDELISSGTKNIEDVLTDEYVVKQIRKMRESVDDAPDLAIGTSKELIETICITILSLKNVEMKASWDLPKLLKETAVHLSLAPRNVSDNIKAADTIRKILTSLSSVVHGIAELRNTYGTGHGKNSKFIGLNSRHAKLAVGASSTLAIFLLETHQIREQIAAINETKGKSGISDPSNQ